MGELGELGRFCLIVLESMPMDAEWCIDFSISQREPHLTTSSSLPILSLSIRTHIRVVHGHFQLSPFSTQTCTFVGRFRLFNKRFIQTQSSSSETSSTVGENGLHTVLRAPRSDTSGTERIFGSENTAGFAAYFLTTGGMVVRVQMTARGAGKSLQVFLVITTWVWALGYN